MNKRNAAFLAPLRPEGRFPKRPANLGAGRPRHPRRLGNRRSAEAGAAKLLRDHLDKDGDLSCEPPGGSAYSVQVIALPGLSTKAEIWKELPKVAKSIAEKIKLKGLEIGDVEDVKTDGIQFTGLRADGKSDGVAFVLVLQGFEPRKGKWFVLMTIGSGDADKAHEDDYGTIAGSITALK